MRRTLFIALFPALACCLLLATPAGAQQDAYALTAVNFNFANPGARARGIGGAFVALADDATASLANPAGIAFLNRQASVEVMHDEEEFPVGQLQQGSVATDITGSAILSTPATDPMRVRGKSSSSRLNYASLTFPIVPERLTVGVYYAALADLDVGFRLGDSLVCADASGHPYVPGAGQTCSYNFGGGDLSRFQQFFPQSVNLTLETSLAGAALGYRLNDQWAVGLSLAMAQTKLTSSSFIEGAAAGAADYTERTGIDDNDLVASLGLLYRGRRWALGANYRSEATFSASSLVLDDTGTVVPDTQIGGELTVPRRIAVGLAYLPTDNWVVAAEADRIAYSDLLSKMDLLFDPALSNAGVSFATDDVTEYHLGVEYTTFREQHGWSVRAGWWRDRTHLPYGNGAVPDPVTSDTQMTQAAEVLLRPKADEKVNHFTAGVGFSAGVVRVDAAVDYSADAGTDFLLSGVVYF